MTSRQAVLTATLGPTQKPERFPGQSRHDDIDHGPSPHQASLGVSHRPDPLRPGGPQPVVNVAKPTAAMVVLSVVDAGRPTVRQHGTVLGQTVWLEIAG